MAMGQRIAYRRVSTVDQNTARQLDGMKFDRVFEDKASGKDTNRPQFAAMMSHVREGDSVFVHSMDRLSRSLEDLLATVREFNAKGVAVHFVTENLSFEPGSANPMGNLLLQILGAVHQFQRSLILETQREGIAKAKSDGKYKGGNNKLKVGQVEQIREMAAEGRSAAEIARKLDVSRQTVYTYTPEVEREDFRGGSNKKNPEIVQRIRQRLSEGASPTAVAKELGVSRQTVYTYAEAKAK